MAREERFSFKVLIKKEPDTWVAHCLELNLVAEAETVEQVEQDIIDIITAHVRYALENDNLSYMYHSAPSNVWREFLVCEDREEASYRSDETISHNLIPVIQANKCFYRHACHA
jgi:hypothetical protein